MLETVSGGQSPIANTQARRHERRDFVSQRGFYNSAQGLTSFAHGASHGQPNVRNYMRITNSDGACFSLFCTKIGKLWAELGNRGRRTTLIWKCTDANVETLIFPRVFDVPACEFIRLPDGAFHGQPSERIDK